MPLLPIIFFCISLLFSMNSQASMYASSPLLQAESLVFAAPEKSLEIIARYLSNKNLSQSNKYPLNPRDIRNIGLSTRTALNVVHAYLINAKAYSVLKNDKAAWDTLKRAQRLVKSHDLKSASLELIFTEAFLIFSLKNDDNAATALLDNVLINLVPNTFPRSVKIKKLAFETRLINAIIASKSNDEKFTLHQFERVRIEIENSPNMKYQIWYQITLGHYFLRIHSYERALSELLSAYWLASENDLGLQIAYANLNLTKLYQQQELPDKALQHANQAAEYFESYGLSRGLSDTQTVLGKIYHQQGKYNIALVHYFNALDIENTQSNSAKKVHLIAKIARTYLQMKRYVLAEEYVNKTINMVKQTHITDDQINIDLLRGELALLTGKTDLAIRHLTKALQWPEKQPYPKHRLKTLPLLSLAYEKNGDFKQSLAVLRRFKQLKHEEENNQQIKQLASFKLQHRNIEHQLQLTDTQKRQTIDTQSILEQKKINLFLIGSISILLLVLMLRHRTANFRTKQLDDLSAELYTHPHSGLKNLRMLNYRLSISLSRSSAVFEQWYLGEMIHEPLNDKLSLAMFEVQFLKTVYLQHGYQQGLKLEKQLGEYLKSCISEPARIYHLSEALFVYIEPLKQIDDAPEKTAEKIQSLMDEFIHKISPIPLNTNLCIGMADYPFLPRALTSINTKKLIDILLFATNAAQLTSKAESANHWVHLSAIDSTPAACFVNTPIRQACFENIRKGLIKVKTSANNGVNWQIVHDLEKK